MHSPVWLRRARTPLIVVLALALALTPASASAVIYWGNDTSFGGPLGTVGEEIGRASLDGSNADRYWLPVDYSPHDLELHDGWFYWPESGRVVRANSTTGVVDRSFLTGLGDYCEMKCDIAVTDTDVYWTERDTDHTGWVGRASIDGTGADRTWVRVGEYSGATSLAADGEDLYVVDDDERIHRVDRQTGAVAVFVADAGMDVVNTVAVDDTHVYFGGHSAVGGFDDEGLIGRVAKSGGDLDPRWVAPENGGLADRFFDPWRIAVDSTHLYWTTGYLDSLETGAIGRVRLADHHLENTLVVLHSDLFSPGGLALDATEKAPRVVVPEPKDTTGPKVRLVKPKKKRATKPKRWKRIRGRISDAGSGPRDVRVKVAAKTRSGKWRHYNGKKWKKAPSRKRALKRARTLRDRSVASGRWKVRLKRKPPKGRVVVRYWGHDQAGNRSERRTKSQRLGARRR